jgi:hypothetical protein
LPVATGVPEGAGELVGEAGAPGEAGFADGPHEVGAGAVAEEPKMAETSLPKMLMCSSSGVPCAVSEPHAPEWEAWSTTTALPLACSGGGTNPEDIGGREDDMIRKLQSGGYRLYSRKLDPKTGRRRNLGTFKTRAAAEKHERAVQYFKRH